jgi:hypothetical protein
VASSTTTSLAGRAVRRYVAEAAWMVEELGDGAVMTAVEGRHGAWACVLTPLHDEELVLIESLAPAPCPPEKFAAVAELLALVNDQVLLSVFTIDPETGAVRVRDAVDVEPLAELLEDPEPAAARLLATPVATNLATLDRWLPALTVVLNSDTLPSEAVETVGGWPPSPPPTPLRATS